MEKNFPTLKFDGEGNIVEKSKENQEPQNNAPMEVEHPFRNRLEQLPKATRDRITPINLESNCIYRALSQAFAQT